MTTMTPDRPRRRWRSLSLRSLMILVLLCGGWLGWWLDRARRQREAVEALRALGTVVAFDDERITSRSTVTVASGPPRLATLRRWLGEEYFRDVAEVALRGRADDQKLRLIAQLGGLRKLSLNYRAGDGDLAALAGLRRLESLDIRGYGLDDRTVAPLGRLTSLKELLIQTTRLTDAGLAPLRSLRRLETLKVEFSPDVRSPGVIELVGALPRLATLSLWWTAVDDAAIPAIERVPALKQVHLPEGGMAEGRKALRGARPGLTVY